MDVRWSFDRLSVWKATPWLQREIPDLEVRLPELGAAPEQRSRDELPLPKVFRIMYNDLLEHGFTGGCLECEYNELN